MQPSQTYSARDNRLRFVFDNKVVSLHLGAAVTFGEVAQTLGDLSRQGYGNPLAIDVTLC